MNSYPIRTFGLARKDWRGRAWTLPALAALSVVLPPLATVLETFNSTAYLIGLILMPSFIGLTLGAFFLSAEEQDPARAFLYTLPLSRAAILRAKLTTLAWQGALVILPALDYLWLKMNDFELSGPPGHLEHSALVMLLSWPHGVGTETLLGRSLLILFAAVAAEIAVLIGAAMQLYCRTVILTILTATLLAALLNLMLMTDALLMMNGVLQQRDTWPDHEFQLIASTFVHAAVALVVLLAWLAYLFCRSALQERGSTARIFFGLLFGAALLEMLYTIFFCDPRDLLYLVFGI